VIEGVVVTSNRAKAETQRAKTYDELPKIAGCDVIKVIVRSPLALQKEGRKEEKIMKHLSIYTLFSIFVFYTSFGQNQTAVKQNIINSETKDTVTSYGPTTMVRNIKKGRNGTILMAGSNTTSFGDVFRYDGKTFTNLTSKAGSHRFYDVLEDRRGNIWFASLDCFRR
jgi:hypothetical protein